MAAGLNFAGLKGLHIASLNFCSVVSEKNMIQATTYIENSNIDCFRITESWLKDKLKDNQIAINNYNFIRHDRDVDSGNTKSKGGGLFIYTASDVRPTQFSDTKLSNRDIELLSIQINKGNYKTLNIVSIGPLMGTYLSLSRASQLC